MVTKGTSTLWRVMIMMCFCMVSAIATAKSADTHLFHLQEVAAYDITVQQEQ